MALISLNVDYTCMNMWHGKLYKMKGIVTLSFISTITCRGMGITCITTCRAMLAALLYMTDVHQKYCIHIPTNTVAYKKWTVNKKIITFHDLKEWTSVQWGRGETGLNWMFNNGTNEFMHIAQKKKIIICFIYQLKIWSKSYVIKQEDMASYVMPWW